MEHHPTDGHDRATREASRGSVRWLAGAAAVALAAVVDTQQHEIAFMRHVLDQSTGSLPTRTVPAAQR